MGVDEGCILGTDNHPRERHAVPNRCDVVPHCGRRKLDEVDGVKMFPGTQIEVYVSCWNRDLNGF